MTWFFDPTDLDDVETVLFVGFDVEFIERLKSSSMHEQIILCSPNLANLGVAADWHQLGFASFADFQLASRRIPLIVFSESALRSDVIVGSFLSRFAHSTTTIVIESRHEGPFFDRTRNEMNRLGIRGGSLIHVQFSGVNALVSCVPESSSRTRRAAALFSSFLRSIGFLESVACGASVRVSSGFRCPQIGPMNLFFEADAAIPSFLEQPRRCWG
jgi:hypothetical protein